MKITIIERNEAMPNPHQKGTADHQNWEINNEQSIKRTGTGLDGTSYSHRQTGGFGNTGCFTGDQLVMVPGGWKMISEVKDGNVVMAFNENGDLVQRKVLRKKTYGSARVIAFEDRQGTSRFQCTATHTVAAKGGWKKAGDLRQGDRVYSVSENGVHTEFEVAALKALPNCERVFNLIVEKEFNFIVKGCSAKSFTYFPQLRGFLWTLRTMVGAPAIVAQKQPTNC